MRRVQFVAHRICHNHLVGVAAVLADAHIGKLDNRLGGFVFISPAQPYGLFQDLPRPHQNLYDTTQNSEFRILKQKQKLSDLIIFSLQMYGKAEMRTRRDATWMRTDIRDGASDTLGAIFSSLVSILLPDSTFCWVPSTIAAATQQQ